MAFNVAVCGNIRLKTASLTDAAAF